MSDCSRCGGKGYIPEYSHIQDGICFKCWGTGNTQFDSKYPKLNKSLQTLINQEEYSSSFEREKVKNEIATLCKTYFSLDSLLREAELHEDIEGIHHYDTKMNEIITKLYSVSKTLSD